MEPSATAKVILGMLAARPRSGYEIKRLVDNSARFFWAASYGQLLPAQPFASHLSFIVQRSNSILNQIKGLVPEIAFVRPGDAGGEIP